MIFVIFFSKMKIFFLKDLTIKFLKVPKMADFEKNAKGGGSLVFFTMEVNFLAILAEIALENFFKKSQKNGQKMAKK